MHIYVVFYRYDKSISDRIAQTQSSVHITCSAVTETRVLTALQHTESKQNVVKAKHRVQSLVVISRRAVPLLVEQDGPMSPMRLAAGVLEAPAVPAAVPVRCAGQSGLQPLPGPWDHFRERDPPEPLPGSPTVCFSLDPKRQQ